MEKIENKTGGGQKALKLNYQNENTVVFHGHYLQKDKAAKEVREEVLNDTVEVAPSGTKKN